MLSVKKPVMNGHKVLSWRDTFFRILRCPLKTCFTVQVFTVWYWWIQTWDTFSERCPIFHILRIRWRRHTLPWIVNDVSLVPVINSYLVCIWEAECEWVFRVIQSSVVICGGHVLLLNKQTEVCSESVSKATNILTIIKAWNISTKQNILTKMVHYI